MRRVIGLFLCCVLAMTVVVRATPRACGSIFTCCAAEAVIETPKAAADDEPSCCEPPARRFAASHPATTHPASDEAMLSCCTPLAGMPAVAPLGWADDAAAFDRTPVAPASVQTRTLEPATPPPRIIG